MGESFLVIVLIQSDSELDRGNVNKNEKFEEDDAAPWGTKANIRPKNEREKIPFCQVESTVFNSSPYTLST